MIYYCTRYHQSQNDKEKQQLVEEMKRYDIDIGMKKKNLKKIKSKTEQKQHIEDEGEHHFKIEMVKDEEIHRIAKKIIELDLHDSVDRTALKQEYKFKIPSNATK